jgi:hypothetical protein
MWPMAVLVLAGAMWVNIPNAQVIPPAGDGDIRVVYWALRDQSELWLTIEPKSAEGKPAPPATILTFTRTFAGRVPGGPPTEVDVRAYAGLMWAPKIELWVIADGRKIDLAAGQTLGLLNGAGSDYLSATISPATLERIASAEHVSGSALGFAFELTVSQRAALRAFYQRALSADPARAK